MKDWFGMDMNQGSTKRGLVVVLATIGVYFFVPASNRQEALMAIIGGHGLMGTLLKD
jgi:hypothetical protein